MRQERHASIGRALVTLVLGTGRGARNGIRFKHLVVVVVVAGEMGWAGEKRTTGGEKGIIVGIEKGLGFRGNLLHLKVLAIE